MTPNDPQPWETVPSRRKAVLIGIGALALLLILGGVLAVATLGGEDSTDGRADPGSSDQRAAEAAAQAYMQALVDDDFTTMCSLETEENRGATVDDCAAEWGDGGGSTGPVKVVRSIELPGGYGVEVAYVQGSGRSGAKALLVVDAGAKWLIDKSRPIDDLIMNSDPVRRGSDPIAVALELAAPEAS